MDAIDCKVIAQKTANDYIVETEDGEKINITTTLPAVRVGRKGKLLSIGGRTLFIREPYGGD